MLPPSPPTPPPVAGALLLRPARCLDQYFAARVRQVEGGEEVALDPRLVEVVERMVER
jgi:hypothetical protein